MFDPAVLLLVVLNFCYIGLLPIIFFKKGGNLNAGWWLTALPFFVTPVFLVTSHFESLEIRGTIEISEWWWISLTLAAVPFSILSISLISLTLGTHRIPITLWHQKDDAPASIVTWGAYARIRHPFYSSFLLAQLSAVLLVPHLLTLGMLVLTWTALTVTAAREERRLSGSDFGAEYQAYTKQTGRFFPRLWGQSS